MSLEHSSGRVTAALLAILLWVAVLAVEPRPTAARPLTPEYVVQVVEERAIETGRVVVLDASALARSIDATGRVAVYGIHFDTDSDRITSESASQLKQIADLLGTPPRRSVMVVGHTDTQGAIAHNRDLSERRAAAVVAALVRDHGVDKARLVPIGVGPAAPAASNRTPEGRAKNRRVEIVELKAD